MDEERTAMIDISIEAYKIAHPNEEVKIGEIIGILYVIGHIDVQVQEIEARL